MNKEQLVNKILQASSDSNGFSVQLRVHIQFDWVKFRDLIVLFEQYVEATRRESCIHRTVFECAYATECAIVGALEHLGEQHREWRNLQSAYADINSILVDLMAPASDN